MTYSDIALGAAVIFAGLWSGLLLTLTTILHPIYASLDGAGLARELGYFLPTARKSPTNYALVIGLVVAPAVALFGLSGTPLTLTAIGLALTITGPLLISRFYSEPTYDVILGWDPAALPDDWKQVRARYFALNWIRAAFTWAAFALFFAAYTLLV